LRRHDGQGDLSLPSVPRMTVAAGRRDVAPVFVVGSPRSGTTLLYHMLLSAGRFANYRAETHVFNALAPRFGDLTRPANRLAMADAFIRSDMFRIAGLEASSFRSVIESDCRNAGDFLRLFMESVCRSQGAERWAETTPVHVLHQREIKVTIPDALFVHVVRDGRDVAVSMVKQGWVKPLPFDRDAPELAAGAFWMWVVSGGQREGTAMGRDYLQVSYERLTSAPQPVLDEVGAFIAQPLSHDEIVRAGIGSVSRPNTSFPGREGPTQGRWRGELDESRARALEALVEPVLRRLGYEIEFSHGGPELRVAAARRAAYHAWFTARDAVKRLPLARSRVSLELFEPGAVKPHTARAG
jgi:hypothetical protein